MHVFILKPGKPRPGRAERGRKIRVVRTAGGMFRIPESEVGVYRKSRVWEGFRHYREDYSMYYAPPSNPQ